LCDRGKVPLIGRCLWLIADHRPPPRYAIPLPSGPEIVDPAFAVGDDGIATTPAAAGSQRCSLSHGLHVGLYLGVRGESEEAVTEISERRLCCLCVREMTLRAEIMESGLIIECSYCDNNLKSYSISQIADRIESVFDEHYRITPEYPDGYEAAMHHDKEMDYHWSRSGDCTSDAIMDAARIPEGAAQDIQSVLSNKYYDHDAAIAGEEIPFSEECHYEQIPASDHEWQISWSQFEQSLKTEARFMTRGASQTLERVFKNIHSLKTWDKHPVIMEVGPGKEITSLHRARSFQAVDPLKEALRRPDLHLGPPPAKYATAGRMNAKGIAVFYGANNPNAALAEVRPPVGSRVAIAEFEIIRPLRLLDLEAMRRTVDGGSLFDPTLSERMGRAKFLRNLSDRITQPVVPDDQDMEYLATQAIAEYLAIDYDPPLDGIAFSSVQAGEGMINIVLFHNSSRVEEISIVDGAEIEVDTGYDDEDGWYHDYSVKEWLPSDKKPGETNKINKLGSKSQNLHKKDDRSPALRVKREAIIVHHVQKIEVKTSSYPVNYSQLLDVQWDDESTDF